MPSPALTADALADLAAGGTAPAPINPTSQAVRTLRAVADLLEVHGDLDASEYVTPYVQGTRAALGGEPLARAILRAGGTTNDWFRRSDGQYQRVARIVWQGVEIEACQTSPLSGAPCGYCDGSGLAAEPEPMAGDGAEACAACGGAS